MATWRKSSFSATNATCIEVAWTKSSRCGTGACLEVAHYEDEILVRDSKHPNDPHLSFSRAEWSAFIQGAKAGEFD
jgi:hypothetical protein